MDNKKRNPIQFFIRLGSFILIVILLQYYLIGPLSMQKEIRNFSQRNQLNRAIRDQREIIFFGDSTMGALGRNDRDKRPIGKMLEDRLKEKVSMIAGSAYSMEIYHAFCTYLKAHAERLPRWIIIPINLRSFSPVWDPIQIAARQLVKEV